MKISGILSILLMGVLLSCNSDLAPKDYIQYVDNTANGLVKTLHQNGMIMTCQYTPIEYMVLKQTGPNELEAESFQEALGDHKNMIHFKVKFENESGQNFLKDNHTTAEAFNTKSMYLSYDIRADLKIVIGGDTSHCAMHHHERTYGNTPFETLLVSFLKTSEKTGDIQFIFDDRVFGFGRVKFHINQSDLEGIPKLKV